MNKASFKIFEEKIKDEEEALMHIKATDETLFFTKILKFECSS